MHGAVTAFLVLSIAGLISRDPDVVRSAYLSMNLISKFAIIPMCLVALATAYRGARYAVGSVSPLLGRDQIRTNVLCDPAFAHATA